MHKDIVFFDIDGTLLDEDKNLPVSTKQAIQTLQSKDVYVVIATGRPPFMFEDLRKELEINSFIGYSGQYVVFEGHKIYGNPIDDTEVRRLHAAALEKDYPMIFMGNDLMRATIGDHPHVKAGLGQLKFAYPEVDPTFIDDQEIYQALLFCEAEQEKALACQAGKSRFVRWHASTLDVFPGGGSKAVGVQKMIEASGLNGHHTYAFGDGLNDLEMFKEVGIGVAMGNAVPELKAIADYITDDVDQDGVLKGLEHFGLL